MELYNIWWINLKINDQVNNIKDWDISLVDHYGEKVKEMVNVRSKETRELGETLSLKMAWSAWN